MLSRRIAGIRPIPKKQADPDRKSVKLAPLIPLAQAFAIGQGIIQVALLQQFHDKPGIQPLEADAIEVYNVFVVAAAQHCNLPLQGFKIPGASDGTEHLDGNFVHIILDTLVHLQARPPLANTGQACGTVLVACNRQCWAIQAAPSGMGYGAGAKGMTAYASSDSTCCMALCKPGEAISGTPLRPGVGSGATKVL